MYSNAHQVNSLTPNADWAEVTGEAANPNLISPERYQELVDHHVMFKVNSAKKTNPHEYPTPGARRPPRHVQDDPRR